MVGSIIRNVHALYLRDKMRTPKITMVKKGTIMHSTDPVMYAYNEDAHMLVLSMCARMDSIRQVDQHYLTQSEKTANDYYKNHFNQLRIIRWALKDLAEILPQE